MELVAKITLLDCAEPGHEPRQLELGVLIPASSRDPLQDAIAFALRKHPGAKLEHVEFGLPKPGDEPAGVALAA